MLSKVPDHVIAFDRQNHPIHIRRRFAGAGSKDRILQWLGEAIGVFSLLEGDDAQHLARAGAQIADTALASGGSIFIDLMLDGPDVEVRLSMDGALGSQAILHHHRPHVSAANAIH